MCYKLDDENQDREIKGLLKALKTFKLKKGYILTFNQTDEIKIRDKEIIITPARKSAWKWMIKK